MRVLRAALLLGILTSPAWAHEWYGNHTNSAGDSCCGGDDCFWIDTEKRNLVETNDEFILDHKWHFNKKDAMPSMDGGYHACIRGGKPRCFFYPQNV